VQARSIDCLGSFVPGRSDGPFVQARSIDCLGLFVPGRSDGPFVQARSIDCLLVLVTGSFRLAIVPEGDLAKAR
jgi:hypothetical protein